MTLSYIFVKIFIQYFTKTFLFMVKHCDCLCKSKSLFLLRPTEWDDPSHACCLQGKSRHVQAAAATRSGRELQPTRARIHGADVRRPVRSEFITAAA